MATNVARLLEEGALAWAHRRYTLSIPEYRASLRAMRQRLAELEPLHDMLGGTGIYFFDEDFAPGFNWRETFDGIAEMMAEATSYGDGIYDDMRGVVFFTLSDMEDVREGRGWHLHTSLPPGDDGHDDDARTAAITAVVRQKLTALGVPNEQESNDYIRITGSRRPQVAR